MINRRKGFTLAETLITITAIAVLAAITLPILNKAKIDKDTVVYRKGMYTIQRAMQKFMESSEYERLMASKGMVAEDSKYLANFTQQEVCEALAKEINTKGKVDCSIWGTSENPNFITIDGIKFWHLGGADQIENNTRYTILFDSIQTTSGEKAKRQTKGGASTGLRIQLNSKGKFYVAPNHYRYEESLIADFTKMKN